MFARLPGVPRPLEEGANPTRKFTADGTPFLSVPGLIRPESVSVAGVQLPATQTLRLPQTARPGSFVETELPLYQRIVSEDGTVFLLRSQTSNDGIWQSGATVHVTGEFEPETVSENGVSQELPVILRTGVAFVPNATSVTSDAATGNPPASHDKTPPTTK